MAEAIKMEAPQNSLVEKIEVNLAEYSFFLGQIKQGQIYDGREVKWVSTGGPIFNRILNAHFEPEELNQRITETVARFKAANTPVTWLIGPATQPLTLGSQLEKHGFTYRGYWHGMALDLNHLSERPQVAAGLTVERVKDYQALKDWIDLACSGFQFSAKVTQAYQETLGNLRLNANTPWKPYIALIKGQPVATCVMYTGSQAAGLYWTATLPAAREHGVGTGLTWELLREAREMGYSTAVLHSTQMGLPLYERLGFQDYCKIKIYTWDNRSKLLQTLVKIKAKLHL
ncbi:MAG: GNAT family N-acetyltransferase [Chloroflexota bacterium]